MPKLISKCSRRESPGKHAMGLLALLASLGIGGCASSGSGGGPMDRALDMVGLQTKPALPDMPAADLSNLARAARKVTLRIHAGEVLNTDTIGRSLALVTKVYILKDTGAFLQASYAALADGGGGKSSTIEGVLETREVVLTPGQKYEVVETLPPEATHLAVVGLFRAPDDRRWRFAFEASAAAKSGITLGAHGCAFSVAEGRPVNATSAEVLRLAGVSCR